MSKGSPKVVIRLTPEILASMEAKIASYNATQFTRDSLNVSEFIRRSILEKLAKRERSNRKQ